MYELNQELVDLRTGSIVTIVDIKTNKKGILYTVQYGDYENKRYYGYRFQKYFAELTGETYKTPRQDYDNVAFIDFRRKSKFANYESWLQWVSIA